jgi:GGDEF domain-containing protein
MLVVILALLGVLAMIEHLNSYSKIESLSNQKQIIHSLLTSPDENLELALIQLKGKSTQLLNNIDKLRNQYKYSYIERGMLLNSKEYLADLDKLSSLTEEFSAVALEYYTIENSTNQEKKDLFQKAFESLLEQIDAIIIKTISYNQEKLKIYKNITYLIFIIVLFAALWFKKRLGAIYKDIEFLHNVDAKEYEVFSQEAGAISIRMKKKPDISENPAMIDPLTGICNIKGMISSYANKKNLKEKNYTSVTVFEIDNFSKTNRVYSQELAQTILKKVAFTISLHEQSADVIARTDYNQFSVILSRQSKEQSFKDIDMIRQSISELKLSTPELGSIVIKLSGGFVIKPNHISLEEAIKQAKKILEHAKETGGGKISQVRDLAHSEL